MVLNPDISVTEDLANRKGWTLEHTREMSQYVTDMAKAEGFDFDFYFDKALVTNSFKAHRFLQFSKTQGSGDAMKELFLKAYFSDGRNTDDNKTLLELAKSIGLDEVKAGEVIDNSETYAKKVWADVEESRQLGISGVPYFVMDRKYGISGAQEVQSFTNNLQKAYTEWSKETPSIVG